MRGVEGNREEFHEVPNAPHDILFIAHILGWKAQAEEVIKAAGEFFKISRCRFHGSSEKLNNWKLSFQ